MADAENGCGKNPSETLPRVVMYCLGMDGSLPSTDEWVEVGDEYLPFHLLNPYITVRDAVRGMAGSTYDGNGNGALPDYMFSWLEDIRKTCHNQNLRKHPGAFATVMYNKLRSLRSAVPTSSGNGKAEALLNCLDALANLYHHRLMELGNYR